MSKSFNWTLMVTAAIASTLNFVLCGHYSELSGYAWALYGFAGIFWMVCALFNAAALGARAAGRPS